MDWMNNGLDESDEVMKFKDEMLCKNSLIIMINGIE
jgi:hypothetical protein